MRALVAVARVSRRFALEDPAAAAARQPRHLRKLEVADVFPEVFAQQVEKLVMEIVHPWLDDRFRRQVVERSLPPLDEHALAIG